MPSSRLQGQFEAVLCGVPATAGWDYMQGGSASRARGKRDYGTNTRYRTFHSHDRWHGKLICFTETSADLRRMKETVNKWGASLEDTLNR